MMLMLMHKTEQLMHVWVIVESSVPVIMMGFAGMVVVIFSMDKMPTLRFMATIKSALTNRAT